MILLLQQMSSFLSGETSSYRSNPLGLAEFALSRKDPEYVGRAKEIQKAQKAIESGECAGKAVPEVAEIMGVVKKKFPEASHENMGFGSTIFAVKPGDGSAREQAASCQKVLGGWANIANEYAQRDTVQTLSTGECFHSSSMRESFVPQPRLYLPSGNQEGNRGCKDGV